MMISSRKDLPMHKVAGSLGFDDPFWKWLTGEGGNGTWGSSGFAEWEGQLSDAYFGFQEFASENGLNIDNGVALNLANQYVNASNTAANLSNTLTQYGVEINLDISITPPQYNTPTAPSDLTAGPGGWNSGGSQTLDNATNASLIGGGITGIVNGAFQLGEQTTKVINLTPAAIGAEKFAQGALKTVRGTNIIMNGISVGLSLYQFYHNPTLEGGINLGVDFGILAIGAVPYVGPVLSIGAASYNAGGGFDYRKQQLANYMRYHFK